MPIRSSVTVFAVLMNMVFGQAVGDDSADHAEKMVKGLKLFKSDVSEVLKQHCVKCHGG